MKKPTNQELYDQCIIRLRTRMDKWRAENKAKPAEITFRDVGPDNMVVVCTIRDAIRIGIVKVNQHGYDMLKAVCEPEDNEPTLSMVRELIEPPLDANKGIEAIQYLQDLAGITEPTEKAAEGWKRMSYHQKLSTLSIYEHMKQSLEKKKPAKAKTKKGKSK